jgi:cytochrome c556
MRIAFLAAVAAAALLTGCGGNKTSDAGNSTATARNAITGQAMMATAAPPMAIPAAVTNKDQALKIMKARQDGMKELGKAMKNLHRAMDAGDMNTVRAQTTIMAATAPKIPSLFPPGTGPDVAKTRAKPDIWKQQDLFLRKSKDFAAAAQAIDAAAKSGDMNKVMALHEDVDKACDACHKPFRAPEH